MDRARKPGENRRRVEIVPGFKVSTNQFLRNVPESPMPEEPPDRRQRRETPISAPSAAARSQSKSAAQSPSRSGLASHTHRHWRTLHVEFLRMLSQ